MVSLSALMFMFLHPFVAIPANYILDTYSLKIGITINCIMVVLGCSFRLLILRSFWWVIVGNFIAAIGNSFILNCPSKYSSIWYEPRERLLITSILVFTNMISGGFGAFLSPFFVKSGLPSEEGQGQIYKLVIFHTIAIGSIMLLNIFCFRSDPWSCSPFSLKKTNIVSPEEDSSHSHDEKPK